MANILVFRSAASDKPTAMPATGGTLVAMSHVDLDTVVETVRVFRDFGKLTLLDDFNGRGHAATATDEATASPVRMLRT